MDIIFNKSFFFIVYCFAGYPVLIAVLSMFFYRPVYKKLIQPSVSVVISVWNEEDVIRRKIENLLKQNYPADKFEILIGSDGSDDKTNEIVRSFGDPRVILLAHPERRGKTSMISELVATAKGEFIIFNDARQELDPEAVQELVNNFADASVGCVSGELVFREKEGGTAKGINLYWKYEKFMRDCEARIHSMLGATGAIYAIRKELYSPAPANIVLDDMYIPFKIIEKGYRSIFDGDAHAYDDVADTPREEHRRKARTLYGNFQMFKAFPHMFNPFKSPIAIQFFSHKLLRLIVPFLMILIFILNLFLFNQKIYKIIFIVQVLFYMSALIGALARNQKYGMLKAISNACYVPYVFCLLNFSALIGCYRFINDKQEITWQKARK